MTSNKHFRLYARAKGSKRFQAVDWSSGSLVGNLIRATIFTEREREILQARDLVDPVNAAGFEFEFRPVKGWSG